MCDRCVAHCARRIADFACQMAAWKRDLPQFADAEPWGILRELADGMEEVATEAGFSPGAGAHAALVKARDEDAVRGEWHVS
jgi:hypothetical protein